MTKMSLSIPASTQQVIDAIEAARQPTADFEVGSKLSGLHQAQGLTDADRKGAWAEASAFNFTPETENPWGTHYGPVFVAKRQDGTPFYGPDIAEIDEEIIAHWEQRATAAQHPVLRARYADIVWDLKKTVTNKQPDVAFAQRAIDAYLDGITTGLYNQPIHAVQAAQRALDLALSINDKARTERCKKAMLSLFQTGQPGQNGIWTRIADTLTANKKVGLTADEAALLVAGLEAQLTACTKPGDAFDPWGAEAAARQLAAFYQRDGKNEEVRRVIRAYGTAFEQLAAQASPTLAMAWLQPVHDEYKNRGMNDDAARVQAASAQKGKDAPNDLKQIAVPLNITEEQVQAFVAEMTKGTNRENLLRITVNCIPNTQKIKDVLQALLTKTPLLARIAITRIVGDHFAAQAGSIEQDPEGRLIMQLAQNIDVFNGFLNLALEHLRTKEDLRAETIVDLAYESPIFTGERRPLIEAGITAYLEGDHIKAIHTLIPQIEQGLRELLTLTGGLLLKPGRNGTMQLKNLNDLLREPRIKDTVGEDLRLYLQTFLADERGQNIRNIVSHGLATAAQFNQRMSDQVLHALLALSLVRQRSAP
jgi:hypothetical protein